MLEGGDCSVLLFLGFLLVILLTVILLSVILLAVVLIGLSGVTHMSNLDFLLLLVPTVLPYPLSYSESESLVSLLSWRRFFFFRASLALFDRFLKFGEAFHDLREGIVRFFLTAAATFLSNCWFRTETLL